MRYYLDIDWNTRRIKLQIIAHKLLLARDACLQFEIKLISLEHVLYNQMWDEDYFPRLANRKLCTEITKLREHVNKILLFELINIKN